MENAAYGITNNAAGTVLSAASVTVKSCTYGVYVAAGTPSFFGLNVTGTQYGVSFVGGGARTVTDGLIYGNTSDGVYVTSSTGTPTITR